MPIQTTKNDRLRRQTRETALEDPDTSYRAQPDTTHHSSPGHQLLMTRFGPVDLLGTIGKRRSYEALMPWKWSWRRSFGCGCWIRKL